MRTVYPLLTLLSMVIVAAGPVPRHAMNDARTEVAVPTRLLTRTESVTEPVPALPPTPTSEENSAGEAQRSADEKSAEHKKAADAMESMHAARLEAEALVSQEAAKKMEEEHVAKAEAADKAHQEAAAKMEQEHAAKAEAEAKAHQEGINNVYINSWTSH